MVVGSAISDLDADPTFRGGRDFAMTPILWIIAALALIVVPGVLVWRRCRAVGLDRWLPAYLTARGSRRAPNGGAPIRLFLCVADHYEPKHGGVSPNVARARVRRWVDQFP